MGRGHSWAKIICTDDLYTLHYNRYVKGIYPNEMEDK